MPYIVLILFLLEAVFAAILITFVDLANRIRKYGTGVASDDRIKLRNYIVILAVVVLLIPALIYFLLME